jgi:hypothetical protein
LEAPVVRIICDGVKYEKEKENTSILFSTRLGAYFQLT